MLGVLRGWKKFCPFFWPLFFGIWSIFCAGIFLAAHPVYFEIFSPDSIFFKSFFSVAPTAAFLFILAFCFLHFLGDKISGLKIFFLLFSNVFLSFILFGFSSGAFVDFSLISGIFRIFATTTIHFFLTAIFLFLVLLFGFFFVRIFDAKNFKIALDFSLFSSFFFGILGTSFLGFLLGKFGIFRSEIFLFLGVFLLLFFAKNLRQFFHLFSQNFFSLSLPAKIFFSILTTIFSLNFLSTFLPFPLGWDGLGQYFLTISILAETGSLRSGIFPPFAEIFLAIPVLFLGISGSILAFHFFGVLAAAGVFFLVRKFSSNFLASLSASAFWLLPAVQFQLSRDLKIDLFFMTIFLAAVIFWTQKRLQISAFFFGASALFKLTSIWFFPAFFVLPFFPKFRKKSLFLFPIFLFLPLGIWVFSNFISAEKVPQNFSEFQSTALFGTKVSPIFKPISSPEIASVLVQQNTGFREEVGRYSDFSQNFFTRFWATLTAPQIPENFRQYTDLGFFFAAGLPFFLGLIFCKWRKFEAHFWGIFVMFLVGFLGWGIFGHFVPWYGFGVLALFLCLSSSAFSQKIFEKIWTFILFATCFLGIWSSLLHFSPLAATGATSFATFPNAENSARLQKIFFPAETAATEILNQNNDLIFRIGTMTKFFVRNPDERIFDDAQLDFFANQIFPEKNGAIALERLRENGFVYLLLDRATPSIEKNTTGSLHQKFADFESFAQKNLKILFFGDRLILFEIPEKG